MMAAWEKNAWVVAESDSTPSDERYWRVRAHRAEREVERLEDRLEVMHLLATAAIDQAEAQRGT